MKQTLQNIIESDDMQYSIAFLIISFVLFLILAGYLYLLTKKESPKPIKSNNDHEVIFVVGPPSSGKSLLIKHLLGKPIYVTVPSCLLPNWTVLNKYQAKESPDLHLHLSFSTSDKVDLALLHSWAFSPSMITNSNEHIKRIFIELQQSEFDALQWISMQSHHIDKVYFTHCSKTHPIVNQTDILYSVYNMASSQLSPIETLIIKHKI
jgi:hypothetical protein